MDLFYSEGLETTYWFTQDIEIAHQPIAWRSLRSQFNHLIDTEVEVMIAQTGSLNVQTVEHFDHLFTFEVSA